MNFLQFCLKITGPVAGTELSKIHTLKPHNVTVLGDGAFRKVIMVKCGHKSGALTQ